MLFELGMDPSEAIKTMRVTRSGAVETLEQENSVLSRPARGEH
jgi:protein-tyrosine phosphatase